ncbi:hypothetical protein ACVNPS_03445 [Candidatus Bipolaricaulota sp. J31]
MGSFFFMLCGSYETNYNPYRAVAPKIRQKILSLINSAPGELEEISIALELPREEVRSHLNELERVGLVKYTQNGYKPNFALFTAKDLAELEPILGELATGLVAVTEEESGLIDKTYRACGFENHGFPYKVMAYILVGAYVFDYGGLKHLSIRGYLRHGRPMPGGNYVFAGLETQKDLRRNWQWGHSTSFGKFTFFGHGELPREGMRQAFPEQAYKWLSEGRPLREVEGVMEEIGKVLEALYHGPLSFAELLRSTGIPPESLQNHLKLLENLSYVKREGAKYRSLCPLVDPRAKRRISRLAEGIQGKFIARVLNPLWGKLEEAYVKTSPSRNDIELPEAFNPLYHLVFEQTIKLLFERGFIPQPPLRPDGARYAVWLEVGGAGG